MLWPHAGLVGRFGGPVDHPQDMDGLTLRGVMWFGIINDKTLSLR